MDRKTFMKDIYSKYWIGVREKKISFSKYDKNLCEYICKKVSKETNILEVGIGTGFPFGNFFQNNGYKVHGIDIAPILIEKCKILNSKINSKVGDAENLEYPNDFFKCVYCFHSTAYFSDLNKVIDEMIRVTAKNGTIIFDIQNRNNKEVTQNYKKIKFSKKNIFGKLLRFIKNILKIILGKGVPDWTNVIYEIPIYPEIVKKYLEKKEVKNYNIMILPNEDKILENADKVENLINYKKIIYVITK